MKSTKMYDYYGKVIPKNRQMCKCGHSAIAHVQIGRHYMNGYRCVARKCTCLSFIFDHIK